MTSFVICSMNKCQFINHFLGASSCKSVLFSHYEGITTADLELFWFIVCDNSKT